MENNNNGTKLVARAIFALAGAGLMAAGEVTGQGSLTGMAIAVLLVGAIATR